MPTLIINGQQVNDITLNGTDVKQISGGGNVLWQNENYRVATPVVSCTANVVTMTCSTSGATIRYSTNGGSSWSTYSSAITISATTTYLAYATKSGMLDSTQVSYTATYVQLTLPQPYITKVSSSEGHKITAKFKETGYSDVTYYMNFGFNSAVVNNPTTSSYQRKFTGTGSNSEYTLKFTDYSQGVNTLTIKCIATKSGYTNSSVKTVTLKY